MNKIDKKRIVVADDAPMIINCIKQTLQINDPNIEIIGVENGQELLDYFSNIKQDEPKPDMIIADCQMPYKQGLEAVIEIRNLKEFANIPVLFQSGKRAGEIKGMREYLELNKNNTSFFQKTGYSNEELIDVVNNYTQKTNF